MLFVKENSTEQDFVIIHFKEDGTGSMIRLSKATGKTIFFDVRCLSDVCDNLKTIRVEKYGKDGIYGRIQKNPKEYQRLFNIAKREMNRMLPSTQEIKAQTKEEHLVS
jgi:hypothetical protein